MRLPAGKVLHVGVRVERDGGEDPGHGDQLGQHLVLGRLAVQDGGETPGLAQLAHKLDRRTESDSSGYLCLF